MDMSASSQEAMAYEEAAEAGEMQLHTTFMFVITASCSLVLMPCHTRAPSVPPSDVLVPVGMVNRQGRWTAGWWSEGGVVL
jgi:hypothetical protein